MKGRSTLLVAGLLASALALFFVGRRLLATHHPPTLATTWRTLSRCLLGATPLRASERPSRRLLALGRASSSPAPGARWPTRCAPAAEALAKALGDSPVTALGRFHERAQRTAELLAVGRLPPDADALWADARAIGIDDVPLGDPGASGLALADLSPIGAGAGRPSDVVGGPVRLLFRGPTRLCELSDDVAPRATCTPVTLPDGVEGAVRLVEVDAGGPPLVRVLDAAAPGVFSATGARLAPAAGVAAYALADGSVARVELDPKDDYHVRTSRGAEALVDAPVGPGAEFVFVGDRLAWLTPTAPGRAAIVTAALQATGVSSILQLGDAPPEARVLGCREGRGRALLVVADGAPSQLAVGDDGGFLPLVELPEAHGAIAFSCGERIARVAWVERTGPDAVVAHESLCDAVGCKESTGHLPVDPADVLVAAPLGAGVLVAWVAPDGSLRARHAAPAALADAPELLLVDASPSSSPLDGFALHPRPDAVVITLATASGTAAIRVNADGDVVPVSVAR